ncbi:MAG: pyruvate kinase alpha/beta domain-containing protein, partial [Planctomycetota bacterium]
LARERTLPQVYAFTPSERTVQRLALVWGVTAVKLTRTQSVRSMVNEGERRLVQRGIVSDGNVYVVIVGTSRRPGMANIMKFRMVGDAEEAAADRGE